MARELKPDRASFNPLCFSGAGMHPQALLVAKLTLIVLTTGEVWRPPDAHATTLFAAAPTWMQAVSQLGWIPTGLFALAAVALLLNQAVRAASVVLGLIALCAQCADVTLYEPHLALGGVMLVVCGLQPSGGHPWLVRAATSAFLATISAVMAVTPGWLSGSVAGFWIHQGVAHPLAASASVVLGDAFWSAMAWLAPASGFSVAVGLLVPRTRTVAAAVLAVGLLLASFGLALPQMQALAIVTGLAALSFLDWPKGPIVVLWPRACGVPLWVRIALDRYDFDGRLDWPLPPDPDAILEVDLERRHYVEARALAALLLRFPMFIVAVFAWLWGSHLLLPVHVSPFAYAVALAPVLALVVMRRLKHAGRRIQQRVVGSHRH